MLNSTVLEVGIGLLFCFCAVSLIVSSINEALASWLTLRARYLRRGIRTLLNDHGAKGLVFELYQHAGFNPASSGKEDNFALMKELPAYVEPRQFAIALTDVLLLQRGGAGTDLHTAIGAVSDQQLRRQLASLYQRAGADVGRFEEAVAHWFEQAMQRLSASYKRTLQWWTVLIGLALALLLNIDALQMFKVLWCHPALVAKLSAGQLSDVTGAINGLTAGTLPIGWAPPLFSYAQGSISVNYSALQLLQMLPGWLITAMSTLFGAPFWFDLLQKVSNLRGPASKVH